MNSKLDMASICPLSIWKYKPCKSEETFEHQEDTLQHTQKYSHTKYSFDGFLRVGPRSIFTDT
jgi:hypothetical protein